MEFNIKEEGNTLTGAFNGRLDTAAAVQLSNDIQPLLDKADHEIILDCTDLEYISSSGLRIFLTIRKAASAKGGKVIVKNINDEVRNVFTMTGFFSLFEVV